jgi:hypothetical protein
MAMRSLTRLTTAFGEKLKNLQHVVRWHFMNSKLLPTTQKPLRVTPTKEARMTRHVWILEEIMGAFVRNVHFKRARYP